MSACGGGASVAAPATATSIPASRDGSDRVGTSAPAWGQLEWVGGRETTLSELRGDVVLVRFWTDTCPFCRASAPALRQLDETYRDRGLRVIGMYHPKPKGTTRSVEDVESQTTEWGWSFPVALDTDWRTLGAYWLDSGDRAATSASFLIDRAGTIRFVHPGPEYHPGGAADHQQCRDDFADLERGIEALLAET